MSIIKIGVLFFKNNILKSGFSPIEKSAFNTFFQ